jgi:hypothetical protein
MQSKIYSCKRPCFSLCYKYPKKKKEPKTESIIKTKKATSK